MESLGIVEGEVSTQALGGFRHALVVLEIDFLILDASPESLHEDVVPAPSPSVLTDAVAFLVEPSGEGLTGRSFFG